MGLRIIPSAFADVTRQHVEAVLMFEDARDAGLRYQRLRRTNRRTRTPEPVADHAVISEFRATGRPYVLGMNVIELYRCVPT